MEENIQRPIIFLDMDDVLCVHKEYNSKQVITAFKSADLDRYPELWANLVFAEARANLAALHQEFYPQYVVSSSWSNYLSQEQMQEVFRRTGLDFVAANMHKHWTTPKGTGPARVTEITNWISKYRQKLQPMLILDDHDSGWNLYQSHLDMQGIVVLCEPGIGLVAEKLEKAQKIIRLKIERYSKYDIGLALMKRLLRPMSRVQMNQVVRLRTSLGNCDQLTLEDVGLEEEVHSIQAQTRERLAGAKQTFTLTCDENSNVANGDGNHMTAIGKFECPRCGWIHIGISESDASASVQRFNEYFDTLTVEQQKQYYGAQRASLDRYLRCFKCSNPSSDFLPTIRTDWASGGTMQPIVAPTSSKT